jgi:outer membrane protein TolC
MRLFPLQFGCWPVIGLTLLFSPLLPAGDVTPPTPDKPWAPSQLSQYEQDLAQGTTAYRSNSVAVDTNQVYDLPALIDIAERSHPETRVAWEQARQAAKAVGLSESAYYPYLAASASAGYGQGLTALTTVFPGHAAEEDATLDLKWLLFDFGGRKATTMTAREELMMANVNFNATHQQIVFAVTKSFYDYNTARQKVQVAESSLQAAQTVGDATQMRFTNGLATKPDVLQAQQQTAEATYDLESARGDLDDALIALAQSMGILPQMEMQVAEVPENPFAGNTEESLETLIDRALSQRPDLVAALANLRARQADVHKARSEYYPKISMEASAGWQKWNVNAYDGPYVGNSKPGYTIGFGIELPIFDGFARANKLRIAQSQLRAAESQLTDSRDTAVRQVWKAYTDLNTAIRKEQSAITLRTAAESAYDAALESYRQGLGTYVDLQNAQRNAIAGRSTVVDARSAILTDAAALALSVGDLAKPANFLTPSPPLPSSSTP